jgi:non-canonical (house-cleaning) NTP pyrophosphatase
VVGYLSKGIMVRKKLTETAVIAALLPRMNPQLYFLG